MLNIHIAEWILHLVTSRDRATSTVGDLVEQAATRGVFWFWSGVLRTAASLLWRDVAENPARVTGVACIGLAVDVAASLLFAGLTGIAFFFAVYSGHNEALSHALKHPSQLSSIWWTIGLDAPPLVLLLLIGRMLARWAPGRELGACLVYAIIGSIFYLVTDLINTGGLGSSAVLWIFLGDAAQRALVLAGAMWGRHKSLAGG
jgi:hypothetical protein